MTREEYAKRMKKHPDWAPGWDAIDAVFAKLYPEAEPVRFESELHDRAALGGEEYLDGFAVYDTGKGYQHIVTYGLSALYPSMAAFGSEYSKWGYELTLKVRESYAETGTWALDLLAQLARYTFQTGNYFEPGAYIPGDGGSLHPELNSAITALAIVSDTTAAPRPCTAGSRFCSWSVSRSRSWTRSRATRTHSRAFWSGCAQTIRSWCSTCAEQGLTYKLLPYANRRTVASRCGGFDLCKECVILLCEQLRTGLTEQTDALFDHLVTAVGVVDAEGADVARLLIKRVARADGHALRRDRPQTCRSGASPTGTCRPRSA